MARPTDYTQELADRICSELSQGKSLRTVCSADDVPSTQTIFTWLRTYSEFLDQYARAKEQGIDAHHEVLEELGDEAIKLAQEVDPKASSAVVQAVKLKADNLKWLMSKLKPKKYGERLDLTSGGEKLPQPIYVPRDDSTKEDK